VFRLGAPASRRRFSPVFAQLADGDASAPKLN
jgi:hypothetical protein